MYGLKSSQAAAAQVVMLAVSFEKCSEFTSQRS